VFRVSVYDHKGTRREFKVVGTRVSGLLNFNSDSQRSLQLRALVQELDRLGGNKVIWKEGGYQVDLPEEVSPPTQPA
jgi:hypothetical protein